MILKMNYVSLHVTGWNNSNLIKHRLLAGELTCNLCTSVSGTVPNQLFPGDKFVPVKLIPVLRIVVDMTRCCDIKIADGLYRSANHP